MIQAFEPSPKDPPPSSAEQLRQAASALDALNPNRMTAPSDEQGVRVAPIRATLHAISGRNHL
jgi:hypothetical protein